MQRLVLALLAASAVLTWSGRGPAAAAKSFPVLIVADEIPAMEVLARQLAERAHATATIVKQAELPEALSGFRAVLVYVHGDLAPATEQAALAYARAGGNLIVLHHSISSKKRKNAEWLPALGVVLPSGEYDAGGYKYFDNVAWDVVNLAPGHPVMRGVKFGAPVPYSDGKSHPALQLPQTEIYLNHLLDGPRTVLLGLRFVDQQTGRLYLQDTAAWTRPLGKGQVWYFMPGHKATDFEDPGYAQMLANACLGLRGH
jgi:hypothetical protein